MAAAARAERATSPSYVVHAADGPGGGEPADVGLGAADDAGARVAAVAAALDGGATTLDDAPVVVVGVTPDELGAGPGVSVR